MDYNKISEIKEEFSEKYFGKYNINGIGIHLDPIGISVHLKNKKYINKIPDKYKEVKIIKEVVGEIFAL